MPLSIDPNYSPRIQPLQGNAQNSCYYTLAKNKKITQVALAILGVSSLAFGIYRPSILSLSVATISLGTSYYLKGVIDRNASLQEVMLKVRDWQQGLSEESTQDGQIASENTGDVIIADSNTIGQPFLK